MKLVLIEPKSDEVAQRFDCSSRFVNRSLFFDRTVQVRGELGHRVRSYVRNFCKYYIDTRK